MSGSTYPVMSASLKLRLKKKAQPGRKGMLEVRKTTNKVTGFVEKMGKTFEKQQPVAAEAAPKSELNNHNSMFHQIPSNTGQSYAHLNPEMALQAAGGAQPIAHRLAGHVTSLTGAQPITAQIGKFEQNSMETGHFEGATLARNDLDSRK